jgi:hypothetical protein
MEHHPSWSVEMQCLPGGLLAPEREPQHLEDPNMGRFAPIQVGLVECLLPNRAKDAASIAYPPGANVLMAHGLDASQR